MSSTCLSPVVEIKADAQAVTFTPDSGLLVSGGKNTGIRVWRVQDGKQVARMEVKGLVFCLAVSKDGNFIAAVTNVGEVFVWDAHTYQQVFEDKEGGILAIDFCQQDSARLLASRYRYTVVWDIAARKRIFRIDHNKFVVAAKYSPDGDRIATATSKNVQVWNSSNGRLLVDITVDVIPRHNTGLLWFGNRLFVISDRTIKQFDASTGSTVSEWRISHSGEFSCIALLRQGKLVAYASSDTIAFWDTLTHTQLFHTQQFHAIRSIALSFDDQFLAIATENKKITITCPSNTIDSIPLSVLYPTFQEADLYIDNEILDLWMDDRLAHAEALLTAAVTRPHGTIHRMLASRALVRTRLGQADTAIVDAEKSLGIQPSLIGYIAKFVALVGKGRMHEAFRTCDIAFQHFHVTHTTTLLLIKAVVLFMVGEHDDAISRMDDLIKAASLNSPFHLVKTYMHLLLGKEYTNSGNYDRAIDSFRHAEAQLLDPNTQQPPLVVSLISGWKFDSLGRITLRQCLCEALYAAGRVKEASEAFLETKRISHVEMESVSTWVADFESRCFRHLLERGDIAAKAHQYDRAIAQYSAALSLDLPTPQDLLVKRSRAYVANHCWEDALNDANNVIKLDPSLPIGYEAKYAALLGAGCHGDAINAFEAMLSTMSQSSNPEVRDQSSRYIAPAETKEAIRAAVKRAIQDSPPELINTQTGRLFNKSAQALSFETQPMFAELISSTTMEIDHPRIEREVARYYRYATFSHKWEDDEPLFDNLKDVNVIVYDLVEIPTHRKLQMFCKIVRESGFNWAWSDTCCINKGDHFVLQEALVSMFKWYQASAMTVVFLVDVKRLSKWEDLTKSIWNTRAWTLQEYHASKVVRFYTQDWTPFMNLNIPNHKQSPEIIAEMEKATGVSAQALMALRPGLGDIREKLRLASTRDTTRVEDTAYSLLGIFGISLPVTYGEGDRALGRLLAQLLTSSGNTRILAWTGRSGSFNSCLPSSISVFKELPTTHISTGFTNTESESVTRDPLVDPGLVARLYDRLNDLHVPFFAGQRVRLPCLTFKLGRVSGSRRGSEQVFRARATALGVVEIRTMEDISQLGPLCLVHPWIDFLLDREPVGIVSQIGSGVYEEVTSPVESEASSFYEDEDEDDNLLPPPSPVSPEEEETRVLGLVTRLTQPFGALLLTPTRQNVEEYRRVASESSITVRIQELTPEILKVLIQSARVLDVL